MSDAEASKKRYELGLTISQLAEETTLDHPEIKVVLIIDHGGITQIACYPQNDPRDVFIKALEDALNTIQGDAV